MTESGVNKIFNTARVENFINSTVWDKVPEESTLMFEDTHTHPFNGPMSGTTRVGRYQKGKTNLAFY